MKYTKKIMAFYDNFLNQFSCSVGSSAQRVKLKNLVALFMNQTKTNVAKEIQVLKLPVVCQNF